MRTIGRSAKRPALKHFQASRDGKTVAACSYQAAVRPFGQLTPNWKEVNCSDCLKKRPDEFGGPVARSPTGPRGRGAMVLVR